MLPLQLLRVGTRKGTIFPLFCTQDRDIELAQRIIHEFEISCKNKERKADLDDRIAALESAGSHGIGTHKLVRGFQALLERRCTFKSQSIIVSGGDGSKNSNSSNNNNNNIFISPGVIRRILFEESSKKGFALTDLERKEIVRSAALKLHLSEDHVLKAMWSDLDDNLILDQFDTMDGRALVGWYNLSLMQTLLFNCTKLEFYVAGGQNWKRVLRNVKRLGLMYYLHRKKYPERGRGGEEVSLRHNTGYNYNDGNSNNTSTAIICSLEGPLSLFKLTDKYGTSLAKLLPSIIFSNEGWYMDAWILRKTMDGGGRKLYEFKISNREAPHLLADPYPNLAVNNIHDKREEEQQQKRRTVTTTAKWQQSLGFLSSHLYFDSTVEEKFARRFEQAETGWKLVREPDPLVLSDGRAFIPDFMFYKYGKKVYLEIVGFWTKGYLDRKMQKLKDIAISSNGDVNDGGTAITADLFVAVNEELACSKLPSSSSSSSLSSSLSFSIPKEKVIFYKNDTVPLRPILDYLRIIDRDFIERNMNDPHLKIELDQTKDIISINEIAQKYDNSIPKEVILKVALRDYGDKYIDAGHYYLISKSEAYKLESLLAGISKFTEACSVLSENSIPESCHAELIAKLGYDVLWQSIDPSTAVIVKRKNN